MSTRVVLVGGAQDGQEFHVPDDDPIIRNRVLVLPVPGEPHDALYRWDGTVRGDGARRYRLEQ